MTRNTNGAAAQAIGDKGSDGINFNIATAKKATLSRTYSTTQFYNLVDWMVTVGLANDADV